MDRQTSRELGHQPAGEGRLADRGQAPVPYEDHGIARADSLIRVTDPRDK